jgi:hypothetical protein
MLILISFFQYLLSVRKIKPAIAAKSTNKIVFSFCMVLFVLKYFSIFTIVSLYRSLVSIWGFILINSYKIYFCQIIQLINNH